MSAEKFEGTFFKEPTYVHIEHNSATAVKPHIETPTPNNIRDSAIAAHPGFPSLTPDNASTVLVFHTDKGQFTLASVRKNPDVDESYAPQINGSIGGYLPPEYCAQSFTNALLFTLEQKFLLSNPKLVDELQDNEEGLEALDRLTTLRDTIKTSEGWGPVVAVHVNPEWKMCVLTAVKHIESDYEQLTQVEKDLALLMTIEKARILKQTPDDKRALRTIADYRVLPLEPIITNAQKSFCLDEKTKAAKAEQEHPGQIIVTFNDFAMERLAAHQGFKKPEVIAKLQFEKPAQSEARFQ